MASTRPPPRRSAPTGTETVAARRPRRSETVESSSDDGSYTGNSGSRARPSQQQHQLKRTWGGRDTTAEPLFPALDVKVVKEENAQGENADGDFEIVDYDDGEDDYGNDNDDDDNDDDGSSPSPPKRPRMDDEVVRTTRSGKAYLGVHSVVSKVRSAISEAQQPPQLQQQPQQQQQQQEQQPEQSQKQQPLSTETAERLGSRGGISSKSGSTIPAAATPASRTNPTRMTRSQRTTRQRQPETPPPTETTAAAVQAQPAEEPHSQPPETPRKVVAAPEPLATDRKDKVVVVAAAEAEAEEAAPGSVPAERSAPDAGARVYSFPASPEDTGSDGADPISELQESDLLVASVSTRTVTDLVQLMQASGWTGKKMWKTALRWADYDDLLWVPPITAQGESLWDLLCELAYKYASDIAVQRPGLSVDEARRLHYIQMRRNLVSVEPFEVRIGELIRVIYSETLVPFGATANGTANETATTEVSSLEAARRALLAEDLTAFIIPQLVAILEIAFCWGGLGCDMSRDLNQQEGAMFGGLLPETCQLTKSMLQKVCTVLTWLMRLEAALAHELGYHSEGGGGRAATTTMTATATAGTRKASWRQLRPLLYCVQDELCRAKNLLDSSYSAHSLLNGKAWPSPSRLRAVNTAEAVAAAEGEAAFANEPVPAQWPASPHTVSDSPSLLLAAREPVRERASEHTPESTPKPAVPLLVTVMDASAPATPLSGSKEKTPRNGAALTRAVHADDLNDNEPMMTSALAPESELEAESTGKQPLPLRPFSREERRRILAFLTKTGGSSGDLATLAADLGRDPLDVASRAEMIKDAARKLAIKQQRPVPRWSRVAGY